MSRESGVPTKPHLKIWPCQLLLWEVGATFHWVCDKLQLLEVHAAPVLKLVILSVKCLDKPETRFNRYTNHIWYQYAYFLYSM